MERKHKSKLKKAMLERRNQESGEKYTPTMEEYDIWFDTINKEVFGDKLPKFDKVEIRKRNKIWADCTGNTDGRNGRKSTKLSLTNSMKSKAHFIEVLAHEMVHLWEFTKFSTMAHGDRFLSWKPKLARFKIVLSE